jgi:hypothetical protein
MTAAAVVAVIGAVVQTAKVFSGLFNVTWMA